jgi:hypothetical protein
MFYDDLQASQQQTCKGKVFDEPQEHGACSIKEIIAALLMREKD